MVGYICGHGFGMSNNVILMDENMVLIWLRRNFMIVSWWCIIS